MHRFKWIEYNALNAMNIKQGLKLKVIFKFSIILWENSGESFRAFEIV